MFNWLGEVYDACKSGYDFVAGPFRADRERYRRMREKEQVLVDSEAYVGDEKRVRERYTKGFRMAAGFGQGYQNFFIDDDTAFDRSKLLSDPDTIGDDEWDKLLD